MKTIGILTAYAHKLHIARPELLNALKEAGYRIVVFGLEEQELGEEALVSAGIKYISIPVERKKLNPFAELKSCRYLAEKAKENHVDLLYSYGIRLAPLCDIAAKRGKLPAVNTINGAGTLFVTGGIKGLIMRMVIVPVIVYSMRFAKKVIFQNKDDYNMFRKMMLVKESQHVIVNGSGVNVSKFEALPLPEKLSFGFDCRMTPEKGIYELLNAFSRVKQKFPEAELNIAGALDGLEKSDVMNMFNQMIRDGTINYFNEVSDIKSFLRNCRIFVFPSYREGTPRSVLEAMACGRPVITTDAPGCRETVIAGENGILVKPKDIDTLTDAMLKLCQDPDMALKMGEKSRSIAEEKFDVNKINNIVIEQINSLLD